MTYKRILKGFYVEITELKTDTDGEMISVKAEVFTESDATRVCKAQIIRGYEVQLIAWTNAGGLHQADIAKLGLAHHNASALESKDVTRYHPAHLKRDPEVLSAMLEHGVAVLVEDRLKDDYYRAHSAEFIFARTSKDRIANTPGLYDPKKRGYWREFFNERLDSDEDVLEIINDRYTN